MDLNQTNQPCNGLPTTTWIWFRQLSLATGYQRPQGFGSDKLALQRATNDHMDLVQTNQPCNGLPATTWIWFRQISFATGYQRPLTANGCSLEDAANSLFRINTVACTIHLEDQLCNEKLYPLSISRGTIGEHSITICCSMPYLTIFQPYSGVKFRLHILK